MKKQTTLEKELNYYIKKQLDATNENCDNQDVINFVKLLDNNYELIIANSNNFKISNKFNSLNDMNIRFYEGIQLYVVDGNGRMRISNLSKTFQAIEYIHYSDKECESIIVEFKKKYYLKVGKVFESLNKDGYTEVSYFDYKNKYSSNEILKNSYNFVTKTIFIRI